MSLYLYIYIYIYMYILPFYPFTFVPLSFRLSYVTGKGPGKEGGEGRGGEGRAIRSGRQHEIHLTNHPNHRVDEEEIDARCDALRGDLLAKMTSNNSDNNGGGPACGKGLKMHQVHEMADAKIRESERLRSALRISKDYEEGGHWKRQEERLKKAVEREREREREAAADSGAAGGKEEGDLGSGEEEYRVRD